MGPNVTKNEHHMVLPVWAARQVMSNDEHLDTHLNMLYASVILTVVYSTEGSEQVGASKNTTCTAHCDNMLYVLRVIVA